MVIDEPDALLLGTSNVLEYTPSFISKGETYFWMFNFSKTADNKFTQIQIDYLINNGGTIWNFE